MGTEKLKLVEPSKFWWLSRPRYVIVFLRELSSVFILLYILLYLQILLEFRKGFENYSSFLNLLSSPTLLAFSILIMAFSLYHSVTWFLVLPKLAPIKLGTFELKGLSALLVNLTILFLASLAVIFLIFQPSLEFLTPR